jgi:hypothetical protein
MLPRKFPALEERTMNDMTPTTSLPARRLNLLPTALTVSTIRLFLGLLLALGVARGVQAQGLIGFAQINNTPVGDGSYNYNITLNNTGSVNIGTFWFAWLPSGQDYLYTMPSAVTTQDGSWTGFVNPGYYYGYSVEYYALAGGLAPGGSYTFGFTSTDTPAAIAGDSVYYPGTPVGTSYLYDINNTTGFQLQVTPAPEPSSVALIAICGLGLLFVRRMGSFRRA